MEQHEGARCVTDGGEARVNGRGGDPGRQDSVRKLEEGVGPPAQAPVEPPTEALQLPDPTTASAHRTSLGPSGEGTYPAPDRSARARIITASVPRAAAATSSGLGRPSGSRPTP